MNFISFSKKPAETNQSFEQNKERSTQHGQPQQSSQQELDFEDDEAVEDVKSQKIQHDNGQSKTHMQLSKSKAAGEKFMPNIPISASEINQKKLEKLQKAMSSTKDVDTRKYSDKGKAPKTETTLQRQKRLHHTKQRAGLSGSFRDAMKLNFKSSGFNYLRNVAGAHQATPQGREFFNSMFQAVVYRLTYQSLMLTQMCDRSTIKQDDVVEAYRSLMQQNKPSIIQAFD